MKKLKLDRTTVAWILAIASFVIGLIVILWFAFVLYANYKIGGELNLQATGVSGDFIGGVVGTLWALTGIFLLYLTLSFQRKELELQREELGLQRKEMEATRLVVKEQSRTMKTQKFENTFFNLLENHSHIVDSLRHSSGFSDHVYKGDSSFKPLREKALVQIKKLNQIMRSKEIESKSYYKNYPDGILKTIKPLESAFKITILIVEFIEKSELEDEEFYAQLLANSMTIDEKVLFGAYCSANSSINFGTGINDILMEEYYKSNWDSIISSKNLPPKVFFSNNIVELSYKFEDQTELLNKVEFKISNLDQVLVEIKEFEVSVKDEVYPVKIGRASKIQKEQFVEVSPFREIEIPLKPGETTKFRVKITVSKKESDDQYSYVFAFYSRQTDGGKIELLKSN